MATFIQNATDEKSPMEKFTPDFSFLAKGYGAKQLEYDRKFAEVSTLYNTVLNSPLTNSQNEIQRHNTFQQIKSMMNSATHTDLTKARNVKLALGVTDPITDDKEIAYDMGMTKHNNRELQRMESYRTSEDPDKRNQYSDYSKMDIMNGIEELSNAKRGDGSIMKVRPREFTPFEDVSAYLNEAAKDQDIEISIDKSTGNGYMMNITNGEQSKKAFKNWAQAQMGDRFDNQFNVVARVESENAIKGMMQNQGLSKAQAIDEMAKSLSNVFIKKYEEEGAFAEATIREIDDTLAVFSKKFPNGNMPAHIQRNYDNIMQTKNGYDRVLQNSRDGLENIKKDGYAYVKNNMQGILKSQAKDQRASNWANTYADATEKIELSPDQVVLTQWQIQSRESQAAADRKLRYQMHQEKLSFDGQKFDIEMGLKRQEMAAEGTLFSIDDLGKFTPEGTLNIANEVAKAYSENKEKIYDESFGEGGLFSYTKEGSEGKAHDYMTLIQKIKSTADGSTQEMTEEDISLLGELATSFGVSVRNPNTKENASVALTILTQGVFQKAKGIVSAHKQSGSPELNNNLINSLDKMVGRMKTSMEQRNVYDNNLNSMSDYIGKTKPDTPIIGYTSTNKPIYDTKGLTEAENKHLNTLADEEFRNRIDASGREVAFNGLNQKELYNLMSNDMHFGTFSGGNRTLEQLQNLGLGSLMDIFSNSAKMKFDPISQTMHVELYTTPAAQTSKTLKLNDEGDIPPSYTMTIPYKQVMANPALARIAQEVNKNTVDFQSTGRLKDLYNNKLYKVTSNSYYKDAGYRWSLIKTKDKEGYPGFSLQEYWDVLNPKDGTIKEYSRRSFHRVDGTAASIQRMDNILNTGMNQYLNSLTPVERALANKKQ